MKGTGVNNNQEFILIESSPILEIKDGAVDVTDKKLLKGTVVKGQLKTRVVGEGEHKSPYRFIQLSNKTGFISPQTVNLYVGNFANLDGLAPNKDKTPVKSTAFGEKKKSTKRGKVKNLVINYGLPIGGAYVGYKIATKSGADTKKMIGYVVFFGLLGCIPRYLYRNK